MLKSSVAWYRPTVGHIAVVLLCLFIFFVPVFLDDIFWLGIGVTMMVWAIAATGWNVATGYAGGVSLGHAAFFGIGAYTPTLLFLEFGISMWIGMLVGALFSSMVGAVLGLITLRLKGPFFVLATLAFGVSIHIIAVNWRELTRGAAGLVLPYDAGAADMLFASTEAYWYIGFGILLFTVIISAAIKNLRLGYYLKALREDEDAARSLGVSVYFYKTLAVVISGALTSCAGTLYAAFNQYIDPASTTHFMHSVQIALVAIVGGMGTVLGPVLGALIVIPLGEILRAYFGGGPSMMVYGFLLIIIVLAAPYGAISGIEKILKKLRRLTRSSTHA